MIFKLTGLLTFLVPGRVCGEESAPVKPSSHTDLDAYCGFRDLKFEQTLASCPTMVILEDAGDMNFYSRKSVVLDLGGIKHKPIECDFYKGMPACVRLTGAERADPVPLQSSEADYGGGNVEQTIAGTGNRRPPNQREIAAVP